MDKKTAMLCARIAHAAYGKGFDMKEFKLHGRFENAGTHTQGIFGVAFGNTFILAFRGSEETGIADWINDLKFLPADFAYGEKGNSAIKVHYGFIEAYNSVREAMFKAAKESDYKQIICTGHSLGAALATLCAVDIKYNLPDKQVSAFTFGSPKVGNAEFVAFYNKLVPQTYRIVNSVDIVPSLPPNIPLVVNYEHVGELHHLGDLQASQVSADVGMCHLPQNYVKCLEV
ncbi:MAG: lipase family protein [Anaerolineales bacterium]|nr:lipase family protein [Anaerolineales bacterium]